MKKLLSLTLCLTSLAAVPLSAGAAGTGGLPPTDFPGTAAVLTGQIARVTREELSRRAALPVAPDEQGELTFQNLHRRVREGNATMLSVDQQLARLNAMDREQAFDDLVSAYNAMTDMLFNYAKMGSTIGAMAGAANPLLSTYNMMDTSFSSAYLQSQQAQLETQLDALKPEEYAETYRESVWQIETGQKQILAGAESLYITILSLERTLEDGNRGLATLDRTLTEMEKRYELGQISQLALLELQNTRAQTLSQLQSLEIQIRLLKAQLQSLVGLTPDGELTLSPLPRVRDRQLDELTPAADLETALAQSLDLHLMRKEMEDAKEDLDDMESGYQKDMAQHAYNAQGYNYEAKVSSMELAFFNLMQAIEDDRQLLSAAEQALRMAEQTYAAEQVKHERGMISDSALLTAATAVEDARSKVAACADNLFASYNNYRWAVDGLPLA